MARRDSRTLDLFEVPVAAAPTPGSMDYRPVVAGLISTMLEQAEGDRYDVSATISRLANKEVSKYMLDAYSSPARDEYNAPAWVMPVLEAACKSHLYSAWLAEVRGGQLLIGRDALNAELGRLESQRLEAARQIRDIKRMMGEAS